jgi:hypothetical protein
MEEWPPEINPRLPIAFFEDGGQVSRLMFGWADLS